MKSISRLFVPGVLFICYNLSLSAVILVHFFNIPCRRKYSDEAVSA